MLVDYGLESMDRCACCVGFIILSIERHRAVNSCYSKHDKRKHACPHYDFNLTTCDLPGHTCRDTPENKFTAQMGHVHRLWVAFKAFKTIQVARRSGWCEYSDTDDFQIVLQLVEQAGLPVFILDKRGHGSRSWIGTPGKPFPGKYIHDDISVRHVIHDKRWDGDPLVDTFARIARRVPWGKRKIYPLPGFISYVEFS